MRLIDADVLKETVRTHDYILKDCFNSIDKGMFTLGIMYAIDEQPTIDTEPHWILCSERLPEDDRSKVVTLANGITEAGYYSNGDWWCIGDTVTLENPTVIAWMPMPKAYQEVKHE